MFIGTQGSPLSSLILLTVFFLLFEYLFFDFFQIYFMEVVLVLVP